MWNGDRIFTDIPVILFNREIDEKDLKISKNVWYVGTDARAAGVMQGELLKNLWKKQSRILDWNGNGMLDYVLVEGEESHFDAIRRTSGFLETGAELPLNQKGNILADFQVPRTGRISHKRIAERFL